MTLSDVRVLSLVLSRQGCSGYIRGEQRYFASIHTEATRQVADARSMFEGRRDRAMVSSTEGAMEPLPQTPLLHGGQPRRRRVRSPAWRVVALGAAGLLYISVGVIGTLRRRRVEGAATATQLQTATQLADEGGAKATASLRRDEDDADDDDDELIEVRIYLREFESVRHFLKGKGINSTTDAETVLGYVPKLTVRYRPSQVEGGLGSQAMGGYVAFCVQATASGARTAAYLVVLTMHGEVVAVRPAATDVAGGVVFYNGLKMRDPTTVLLAANYDDDSGAGPVQLWDWVADDLATQMNGSLGYGTYTSHDVEFVSAAQFTEYIAPHLATGDDAARGANGTRDRIWRPSESDNELFCQDAETGELARTLGPFDETRTYDLNHFQVAARPSHGSLPQPPAPPSSVAAAAAPPHPPPSRPRPPGEQKD